jgi:hypothetical protein
VIVHGAIDFLSGKMILGGIFSPNKGTYLDDYKILSELKNKTSAKNIILNNNYGAIF